MQNHSGTLQGTRKETTTSTCLHLKVTKATDCLVRKK